VGGNARADVVGVGNQHHGAVLDEEEILTTDFTDLKTGFKTGSEFGSTKN
jgi:hypothetical protein